MKKRNYFTMTPLEQRTYRTVLFRRLKSSWENDVIYRDYAGSFEQYTTEKAQQLEDNELYEELQALIDYFDEN